jgi:hypothetical protein
MKRRLIIILATVSLLICIATGIVWLRSVTVTERIEWSADKMDHSRHVSATWLVYSSRGQIGFVGIRHVHFSDEQDDRPIVLRPAKVSYDHFSNDR